MENRETASQSIERQENDQRLDFIQKLGQEKSFPIPLCPRRTRTIRQRGSVLLISAHSAMPWQATAITMAI